MPDSVTIFCGSIARAQLDLRRSRAVIEYMPAARAQRRQAHP